MEASTSIQSIAADYWEHLLEVEPYRAVMAGIPAREAALWKYAPADCEYRCQRARELHDRLLAVPESSLGVDDRATHGLLGHELELVSIQHQAKSHLRPSLFPLGPEFALDYLANMTALGSVAKAESWLRHLRAVPDLFAGLQHALSAGLEEGFRYPRRVLECAVANVRGLFERDPADCGLFSPFRKSRGTSPAIDRLAGEALEVVRDTSLPAIRAYAEFLQRELMPAARESVAATDEPQGAEHYRALIRQHVTLDLEPSMIHRIGLDEVERIREDLRRIVSDAGFGGDLEAYGRHLQSDPGQFLGSGEALRETIEVLSKRIDALIPQFFGRIPRITYGVQLMPEAVAKTMPPAYAQFNPTDRSSAGVHWLNPLPARCPRFMHVPLALHEAWPGHLMHIALTQELESLPEFRRNGALGYSSWTEGWALYCEELGVDMGLYQETWQHYGRLSMELWRAVRLVVDTGLHSMGWSRERAIDYAAGHLALPRAVIESEVDRYIGMPGQALAYQLGKLTVMRLRDEARRQLGEAFNLRDFHDTFLGLGPVTLPVMETLMREWIGASCRS